MTTDHARRAAIMYPNKAASADAARPSATTGRAAAAATMYGPTKAGQVGSIDNALASTFGRLRAGVTDKETLARLDDQRLHVGKLLREKNIAPSDAHAMLSIYCEHKLHSRSTEALEKRWIGPAGYAEVRRDAGSEEAANARLAGTDAVLRAVAKVSPTFARDLIESGASQHADFIKVAAKIVENPKPIPAAQS